MATNFVSNQTCLLGAEVSQDPLERFSQSLHHIVDTGLQMINPILFLRYLKGRCHGNQLKLINWRFLMDQSTLSRCHSERDCNIAIAISKD